MILGGCDRTPVAADPAVPSLVEIDTVDLSGVPEPSGLALDIDGVHLWTVSDRTGTIYRLTLSGTRVATLDVGGQDLEGITVDPADGTLYVTEEGLGQVLHFDREGNLLATLTPAGLPEMGNSGLEGITIDTSNGHLFLLKEKNPGLLVEIDTSGQVLAVTELVFADDYSGLAYDATLDQLLVVSDQSATLTWCNTEGAAIKTLATHLDKGEGIAIGPTGDVYYVVSDSRETLSSFQVGENPTAKQ